MRVRGPGFRALVVPAALAVVLGGCGDEASPPGRVRPTAADMAMVAADLALVAGSARQQYTVAGLVAAPAPAPGPRPAPAAIDTLLRGQVDCPVVRHHTNVSPSFYEFRYATGCVSDFDGRQTSGTVQFTVDTQAPFAAYDVFSEFFDFTRDGRRLRGIMEIKGSPLVPLTLEASGLDVSGRRAAAFVGAQLDLAPAGDPCGGGEPICEGWRVTEGTGSVSTSLYLYNISVQDTLVVSGCHPHFVSGVIAVTSAGTYPAFIDFGDGTCDDTATMTVEGRTETITLGYGS